MIVAKKKHFDSTGGSGVREVLPLEYQEKPKIQEPLQTGQIVAESGFQKGQTTPISDSYIKMPASGSLEQFTNRNRSSQLEPPLHSNTKIQENYWGYAAKPDQKKLENQKLDKTQEKPPEKYNYYGATANDIAKQFSLSKAESAEGNSSVAKPNISPASKVNELRKISEEDNEADWGPRKFYNTAKKGTSNINKDLSP